MVLHGVKGANSRFRDGAADRRAGASPSVASLDVLDSGERGWWRPWLGRVGWAAAERSVRALVL